MPSLLLIAILAPTFRRFPRVKRSVRAERGEADWRARRSDCCAHLLLSVSGTRPSISGDVFCTSSVEGLTSTLSTTAQPIELRKLSKNFPAAASLVSRLCRGRGNLTYQSRCAPSREFAACDYDWVIHCDADEWLCSPLQDQSLLDGLTHADAAGFTCVNFHELVFVALPGESFEHEDYFAQMQSYFFFQPSYPRLERAWSRRAGLNSFSSGSHTLDGTEKRRYPLDFILRHYICLSDRHGSEKYLGRRFSSEDREHRWHGNRLRITAKNLRVKPIPELKSLADPAGTGPFDLNFPVKQHFWEW